MDTGEATEQEQGSEESAGWGSPDLGEAASGFGDMMSNAAGVMWHGLAADADYLIGDDLGRLRHEAAELQDVSDGGEAAGHFMHGLGYSPHESDGGSSGTGATDAQFSDEDFAPSGDGFSEDPTTAP